MAEMAGHSGERLATCTQCRKMLREETKRVGADPIVSLEREP